MLVPATAPGTPTVSNAKVTFNRVLVRNLKLLIKVSLVVAHAHTHV